MSAAWLGSACSLCKSQSEHQLQALLSICIYIYIFLSVTPYTTKLTVGPAFGPIRLHHFRQANGDPQVWILEYGSGDIEALLASDKVSIANFSASMRRGDRFDIAAGYEEISLSLSLALCVCVCSLVCLLACMFARVFFVLCVLLYFPLLLRLFVLSFPAFFLSVFLSFLPCFFPFLLCCFFSGTVFLFCFEETLCFALCRLVFVPSCLL